MIGDVISESPWLLLLIQGTACIATGLAAGVLLRHRPARAHQALLTALLASILMPGAYALVKHLGLGALAARPAMELPAQAAEPDEPQALPSEQASASDASIETETASLSAADFALMMLDYDAAPLRVPWGAVAVVCWIAASALLLVRLALRFLMGLRLLKTAHPLENERIHQAVEAARDRMGILAPVRIRCSGRIKSPVIWCWTREPVLLLHTEAHRQQDSVDWVGVFCHEFAHLRRRDYLSSLFVETLTALFPWHPLLWWARDRLVRLGEQACDDWVLAAGQTGVDYAESLLDLSPQRHMAILPGIVGKEKAMTERIRRIIENGCSNPTVGMRWAAVVSVLAVLAAVGVAFAQRRPVDREPADLQPAPELRKEAAVERPAVVGRRNVLMRLREQLQSQIDRTENALREGGDGIGAKGPILQAEIATLREQITRVDRELRTLETRPRRAVPAEAKSPRPAQAARRPRVSPEQKELLIRELEGLRARGQELQRNLQERPDMEPARAEALRQELRQIRQKAAAVQQELQGPQGGRGAGTGELPQAARPRVKTPPVDAPQLARPRAKTPPVDTPQADRRPPEQVRQRTDRKLPPVVEGDTGRQLEPEVDRLRNQMNGLREQMQQMQRTLEQLVQQRAGEQPASR